MANQATRNARVVELTEFISVKTIVIKASQSSFDNIGMNGFTFFHDKPTQPTLQNPHLLFENLENLSTSTLPNINIDNNMEMPIITKTDVCCQVTPELTDIGVNTEASSSECDVYLKTKNKCNYQSTATQCTLSDESDEDNIIESQENRDITNTNFEDFIKNKCLAYDNDIYECKMCGEISKGTKELHEHMTNHWNSNVLCCKCGRLFDSTTFLARHNCTKIRRYTNLLCTHIMCPVVKSSLKSKHKSRCCVRDPYERFKSKRLIKRMFDYNGIKRTTYKFKYNI